VENIHLTTKVVITGRFNLYLIIFINKFYYKSFHYKYFFIKNNF